jgi:hypothetical protein
MPKSVIEVDQAGNFQIDEQGFNGTACEETTKKLMAGIAAKSQAEHRKPEFHGRQGQSQTATQRW